MTPQRTRALAASVLVALALAAALLPSIQAEGAERIDAMFGRALATFAAARALNGAISVVQGTEVALQPAGIGVTLTVGEILDPLNDLVERFSWVMLAATAALGTQSVLLEATAATPLTALLVAAALATILRTWWPTLARLDGRALVPRALLVLLFVRLALPCSALAAHAFSEAWLEPRRAAAVTALERTRAELDAASVTARSSAPEENAGMIDELRRFLGEQSARLDPSARLTELVERLDTAAGRVIDLIVVFLLETIVVPLASLWLLWRLTCLALPPTGVPHD